MLARYLLSSSVRLSVRPSHAGIVPKQLNLGSRKQRRTIALEFSDAKNLGEIPTGSFQRGQQINVG